MKPRCILINPWVYDFAAVNLWSRPLGLLRLAEYLSQFDVDLTFIDCMHESGNRKFGMGKYHREIIDTPECVRSIKRYFARYGMSTDHFKEKLRGSLPCDIVFVTSIMSYWYPGVQKVIECVKSLAPDTPVILGGVYAALYHRHAEETSGADYVYRGHIGDPFADSRNKSGPPGDLERIIESFGLTLTRKRKPVPYYKLGLYSEYPFAPLLTSVGCPFTCSYCASGILHSEFIQRHPLEVFREIRDLYTSGVQDYAFYDDALFVNSTEHIKVLLKEVIHSGMAIRFHCPNGLHTRFIDDEMASLMMKSGFTTIRLGFETVNHERQTSTGGKVTSDDLRSAVHQLNKHGFTRRHIGVYLMYGLPGQGLREVSEGVEFLKHLDVNINLTEFSPIPGTSCWDTLLENGTMSDDIDPLLTNNSIFTHLFSDYDMSALEELRSDVRAFNNRRQ